MSLTTRTYTTTRSALGAEHRAERPPARHERRDGNDRDGNQEPHGIPRGNKSRRGLGDPAVSGSTPAWLPASTLS